MLDLQVDEIHFVVDRGPNAEWHLSGHHRMKDSVLAYAKEGRADYVFHEQEGPRRVSVRRGNVLFIRRGTVYSAHADPESPWSFYSCAFTHTEGNPETSARLAAMPTVFTASDSTHMNEDFSELFRAWTEGGEGSLLQCRSRILDILYLLLSDDERRRTFSAHTVKIREIADLLRRDYTKNYSIDELSAMAGLSSSHFRTLFRQTTGMTTVQYVTSVRIARAKDLLLSRTCNVSQAARAVGFSDVFYFSRVFRKVTGMNPSEFT